MFTEETKLLIEHWSAVEEIIQAEGQLRTQLTGFLLTLKDDLIKQDWWSDNWNFIKSNDDQVYIAHNNWRRNKSEFVIWIGIEFFRSSELFGKGGFSQLYVWTAVNDKPFITKLRELFVAKRTTSLGSVEGINSNYIIKHFLPKIMPSQSGEFENIIRCKIIEFFSFYAKEEESITEIVTRQIK